ncbi:hypothetical protein KIW84_075222 [Lathyrus oleraceus]|uniref:Uncharacterized protein n=1 Tax=Pisum sativum TaxID=3888 RepID=A0A9D4ZZK5_PEA|nr:hypothetical protein KIW84_075222 [Pisum sativum]
MCKVALVFAFDHFHGIFMLLDHKSLILVGLEYFYSKNLLTASLQEKFYAKLMMFKVVARVLSEKHDQFDHDLKEKSGYDVNSESWQSNDFKDVLTVSDEGDGSPAAVTDEEHYRTGNDWLEDDECFLDSNEVEFLLNNREEVEDVKSLSDIDELNNAFWKLNKVEIGPQSTTVIGARGSRENSMAEWTQNDDLNWFDQNPYDIEGYVDGRRLLSQPYPSLAPLPESNSLYKTSSYPEQ